MRVSPRVIIATPLWRGIARQRAGIRRLLKEEAAWTLAPVGVATTAVNRAFAWLTGAQVQAACRATFWRAPYTPSFVRRIPAPGSITPSSARFRSPAPFAPQSTMASICSRLTPACSGTRWTCSRPSAGRRYQRRLQGSLSPIETNDTSALPQRRLLSPGDARNDCSERVGTRRWTTNCPLTWLVIGGL